MGAPRVSLGERESAHSMSESQTAPQFCPGAGRRSATSRTSTSLATKRSRPTPGLKAASRPRSRAHQGDALGGVVRGHLPRLQADQPRRLPPGIRVVNSVPGGPRPGADRIAVKPELLREHLVAPIRSRAMEISSARGRNGWSRDGRRGADRSRPRREPTRTRPARPGPRRGALCDPARRSWMFEPARARVPWLRREIAAAHETARLIDSEVRSLLERRSAAPGRC